MSSSYNENGFPWTRLGYTYDWGRVDSEVTLGQVNLLSNKALM